MVLFILVRHGETDWNKEQVFRGRADIPLNQRGAEQARRTAAALLEIPVSAVLSSPLSRAYMTAREIAAVFGLTVEKVEDFTDIHFGCWEGMGVKEVNERYPRELKCWRETPHRGAAPGGETLAGVTERAWSRLDRIARGRTGEAIVVVTHRVVLKLILMAALGIDQSKFWQLQQDPCALNILHYRDDRYILSKFNESCHLQGWARGLSQADF